MNNVQPAPEHVRTELVEGQLLHRGFRQNPSLRVLQTRRVDRWGSRWRGGAQFWRGFNIRREIRPNAW